MLPNDEGASADISDTDLLWARDHVMLDLCIYQTASIPVNAGTAQCLENGSTSTPGKAVRAGMPYAVQGPTTKQDMHQLFWMLARAQGPTLGLAAADPPARQKACMSSTEVRASMKSMSAPASAKAAARHRASCKAQHLCQLGILSRAHTAMFQMAKPPWTSIECSAAMNSYIPAET